jgi:hypothetical protein
MPLTTIKKDSKNGGLQGCQAVGLMPPKTSLSADDTKFVSSPGQFTFGNIPVSGNHVGKGQSQQLTSSDNPIQGLSNASASTVMDWLPTNA